MNINNILIYTQYYIHEPYISINHTNKKNRKLAKYWIFYFFLSLGSLFARDTSALSKNTEKQILNEK